MRSRMLPPLLLLVLLVGPALSRAADDARPRPAPGFSLPAREGTVALDSLRGRVVYLDFWASWCGPCRASFPWMETMQRRYGARGLTVVGVNLDRERRAAEDFLARNPASFAVAFDPSGRTAVAYGVRAMPTSYLIGRDGTVLSSHAGFSPGKAAELEARIQDALAP